MLNSLPSLANISSPSSGCGNPGHYMQPVSSLTSQIGPVLRVGSDSMTTGRDGRISTSSPLASTGIMHGSPVSDDSSQHSDSGMLLKENTSNGVIGYSRKCMSLDNALYSQIVLDMSTLAKDPSPRIARMGRKALSIIGIEQVVSKTAKYSGSTHQGELSAPPSSTLAGLARSSSWFDMNAGNFLIDLFIFQPNLPHARPLLFTVPVMITITAHELQIF